MKILVFITMICLILFIFTPRAFAVNMEFNGTTTTSNDVTFSFSTGEFVNGNGTEMTLYLDKHPYATPVNGGGDYADITISQAINITAVTIAWSVNAAGMKLVFMNGSNNVVTLSNMSATTYTVNAYVDKIRFQDDGGNSGGFEVSHVNWDETYLPVELVMYRAIPENGAIVLEWAMGSEAGSAGFVLERSLSGTGVWQQIASYITDKSLVCLNHQVNNSSYRFTDKNVTSNNSYSYRLSQVDLNGRLMKLGEVQVTTTEVNDFAWTELPKKTELLPAFPNPFNAETKIRYLLAAETGVEVSIHNILGKKVRQIVFDVNQAAGNYSVKWDAKDDTGHNMCSGIYFIMFKTENLVDTRKIMFIK